MHRSEEKFEGDGRETEYFIALSLGENIRNRYQASSIKLFVKQYIYINY